MRVHLTFMCHADWRQWVGAIHEREQEAHMKMHRLRSVVSLAGKRLCLAALSGPVVLAGCQGPERPRPLAQEPAPAKVEMRAAPQPAKPLALMDVKASAQAKQAPAFAPYS